MAKCTKSHTQNAGRAVIIKDIVAEHADEAPFLWFLRDLAVRAPQYDLDDLVELDERLEANLEGLRVGGEAGWEIAAEQLSQEEAGEVFVAGVLALESRNPARLELVLAVAEAVPETARGFISALGWVTPQQLKGTGKTFLNGGSPFLRRLGIAACSLHRVDPGPRLDRAIADDEPALRARALRAAGELGRKDLLAALSGRLKAGEKDPTCRFWATWSSVLLGDRGRALESLRAEILSGSPFAGRALQLAPRALEASAAQAWLKGLVADPKHLRSVVVASGVRGDPHYAPWLIRQMETPEVARVAGEAFSMITGVDLADEDLEGEGPDEPEAEFDEESAVDDIAMDPDEDLPWPDPKRVRLWWDANKARFEAGTRNLAGQVITAEHCRQVLRTGFQRQRVAAALELVLMEPGSALFETRAPGKRQLRLLDPE